jgi:hypothetical protein
LLLQPNESGDNSRERIFTPKLTFFAFLDQVLDPESSCRSALDQILAYYQSLAQYPHIAKDTSAYCQARARWTCDELVAIRRALARGPDIHGDTLLPGIPGQRSLKVIDGTGFNLPDTGANRQLCPNPTTRNRAAVFRWCAWSAFSVSKPERSWRKPPPLTASVKMSCSTTCGPRSSPVIS